jgi:hypothetical protein
LKTRYSLLTMPNERKRRARRKGGRKSRPSRGRMITSGYRSYPGPVTIPLNQRLMLQFRNIITVTSSAGGIVDGTIPCNPAAILAAPFPAAALFPEWTDVSPLFAQVKCVQLECTYRSCYVETKGDTLMNLGISGNLQSNGNPGSYTVVIDNGDSQTWTPTLDTACRGAYHAIRHLPSLQWAAIASPFPSGNNYIGCPGGIGCYGSGYPVSTQLFNIHVVGTYLFQSRT